MRLSRKETQLLGLTVQEKKVLEILSQETHALSSLARATNISVPTLVRILPRLEKRGLIRKIRVGKRHQWTMAGPQDLEGSLLQLIDTFVYGGESQSIGQFGGGVTCRVHRGVPALIALYRRFAMTHPHEHVLSFQPFAVGLAAIQKSGEAIHEINELFNTRKVVVEGVLSESYFERMVEHVGVDWLERYEQRVASIHVIPDSFIDLDAEITIAGGVAFFLHWESEVAFELHDPNTVEMLRILFEFLQFSGKKINLHAHVQKLLHARS